MDLGTKAASSAASHPPRLHGRRTPVAARALASWLAARLLLVLALLLAPATQAQLVRAGPEGAVALDQPADSRNPNTPTTPAAAADPESPLGRSTQLLDEEPDAPLTIDDARRRLAAGDFHRSTAAVPNLGNHAPPRWIHLAIDNPGTLPLAYRLYIAEGWTDRLDAWLFSPQREPIHWQAGDELSPARYLRMGLGFAVDAALPPGRSELFVRADSIDSAALALRLIPLAETAEIEAAARQWLGLVHGFLLALVATYGLLWLVLREANLLRYVAYVGSYLCMHLAYSGVATRALWPDEPALARFAILIGMTMFASAGLWFARGFLGLAELAPKVDRAVAWVVRLVVVAMALCIVGDWKVGAVDLAFIYITLFTFVMVGLGVLGVRRHREQAPIFLTATLLSMAGTLVTTLAVMGRLPFSALTFRAVEVGVMVEAAVWALALGLRLRRQQADRVRALELARHDPLTGLDNRRGFFEQALPVYRSAGLDARPLAMLMIDIDHFKRINDKHGHDAGDRTLVAVAEALRTTCRVGDIVARWGGEEFVMLLPETDGERARALAERLRLRFAATVVSLGEGGSTRFTASFGVAVRSEVASLEDLLRASDAALYAAKHAGRNRVVSASDATVENRHSMAVREG